MNQLHTASVSGFRNSYKDVLQQVTVGPVLLLQNSKLAAVLISPKEWNEIATNMQRLRDLEQLLEAKKINAQMDANPSSVVTHEELKRRLAEKAHKAHVAA